MNKDVIYIDIEDDITGIIGKVKSAKDKIVALVPPKRVGALQSAVNLKLLQKAAREADKRVVLITNDHSLTALAAGVKMPVAKNLQSRPEVPEIAALEVDNEEIINGEELPVGDIAASRSGPHKPPTKSEQEKMDMGAAVLDVAAPSVKPNKPSGASKLISKVPNFERFRRRFLLIGGGVVVLIIFLVWAIWFAPGASVTISAKTSPVNIDQILSLDPSAPSDPAALKLKADVKQLKKSVVAEFTATGTKDIGNQAAGTLTVRNCDYAGGFTLPAGSKFTADDGHVFASAAAVSVPTFTGPASSCSLGGASSGKATVAVKAVDIGPEYNVAAQGYDIDGISGKVDGVGGDMAGGTRQTVTVVSQADVDKAKTLLPQQDQNSAKDELKAQFTGDQKIIDASFAVDTGQPVVAPEVGQQAQQGKVTIETTYTLVGLAQADLKAVAQNSVNSVLQQQAAQQVYELGDKDIVFQSFQKLANGLFSSRMVTTAQIGPKIDAKALAQQITGKRSGEAQQLISDIPGVDNVKVSYSPFWVTHAPSADKIDIKFSVSNAK